MTRKQLRSAWQRRAAEGTTLRQPGVVGFQSGFRDVRASQALRQCRLHSTAQMLKTQRLNKFKLAMPITRPNE